MDEHTGDGVDYLGRAEEDAGIGRSWNEGFTGGVVDVLGRPRLDLQLLVLDLDLSQQPAGVDGGIGLKCRLLRVIPAAPRPRSSRP